MSASYNFTGRDLLTADEIKRIKRPYQLVTSRAAPCVMYAPDISQTPWNDMLGLGDMDHNRQVIIARNERRPTGAIETAHWGIWKMYTALLNSTSEKG